MPVNPALRMGRVWDRKNLPSFQILGKIERKRVDDCMFIV
jgi:hypothetical protein